MMDRNTDKKLNKTELLLAITVGTRGLARMKRVAPPPQDVLEDLADRAFSHEEVEFDASVPALNINRTDDDTNHNPGRHHRKF